MAILLVVGCGNVEDEPDGATRVRRAVGENRIELSLANVDCVVWGAGPADETAKRLHAPLDELAQRLPRY